MTSPTDPAPKPRPAALLDGAPAPALLRQALPLALILSLNGLLGLADAVLLGRFVGAKAMAASEICCCGSGAGSGKSGGAVPKRKPATAERISDSSERVTLLDCIASI